MRLQPIFDIAAVCASKGIEDAIVCPGSRCAPLTLAFARHPAINTRTITDERSAGFIALGIAQQTRRTVVLICTSGTAAYNFAPAIAEAFYQRIPLLILTADRPVEWIGQWDGQTIAQQQIYGNHVLKFYQLPQEYDDIDSRWSINRMLNEGINTTQGLVRGPVHVNVPLKEPLYSDTVSFSKDIRVIENISSKTILPSKIIKQLASQLDQFKKVLVVGGQNSLDVNLVTALNTFRDAGNIAVVGDIISNLHPLPGVVRYSDSFLPALDDSKRALLKPDLLITIGQSVISKNLKLFIRGNKPTAHWHIDESTDDVIDPFQSVTTLIRQDPAELFNALSKAIGSNKYRAEYSKRWLDLENAASETTQEFFNIGNSGEFAFVNRVMQSIPDHTHLHLANSMSVRYANLCGLPGNKKGVAVYSNRGTSGIDGCTSTVVGHALSSDAIHTLITGDVAFFYDRNAFWNKYPAPNLRIVLLNNHGGAIFGMIDGPGSVPEANEYFITQQVLTAQHLAAEFDLDYKRVSGTEDITTILADFYTMNGKAKILEFESNSNEAKDIFLLFKKAIKEKLIRL